MREETIYIFMFTRNNTQDRTSKFLCPIYVTIIIRRKFRVFSVEVQETQDIGFG